MLVMVGSIIQSFVARLFRHVCQIALVCDGFVCPPSHYARSNHHHVIYLEVRSTPKRLLVQHQPDNSNNNVATKRDYVDTVLSVLHEFQQQDEDRYQREIKEYNNHHNSKEQQQLPRLPMTCRVIISVD
jgi:hypothetical protein